MPSSRNKGHFAHRIALVTGGASGIGRALCEALAQAGAVVIVADINLARAEEVAKAIRERGGLAEALGMDVASEAEVEKGVDTVVRSHGRLDYMFNNAGIAAVGELRDGNMGDFRRVLEVNLFGVVHGTMAAYRVMLRQGFGHIVNISSLAGLMSTPILTAYTTSKWGIVGFSTVLRAEARDLGIKVSVVCPGLVRTNIGESNLYWNVRKEEHLARLPRRWMVEPQNAAQAILRGVARNRRIIVFPFSARVAWWIYRICPWAFSPLVSATLKKFRRTRMRA